ncbi:MAG: pyruvate kinase [Betaproteobacteria bacterium]|nr:pyruvate kinase [Betaproteobacteria bacterium]
MILPPWHRTKIVCTLGPATDAPGVLGKLIAAGMDVARINMSHGSHAEHVARIRAVRLLGLRMEQPVAVLADLPGPKFRLGPIANGSRRLEEGAAISLASTAGDSEATLPVRNPELLHALRAGETVFLADGAVELRVTGRETDSVQCEVAIGGTVRSGSGINVPESRLEALIPTDDDRRHLAFALAQDVDWVGVSFVQSAEDIARVRACIDTEHPPLLMAKIEKRQALANLDAIVAAADGVMVARGDLGVETDLAHIAIVQKRIIAVANAQARPVVTATQMLESMIEHEHPTRAEVADVANAVLDGTDAVMLSGETAIGRHPVEAVAIMARVLRATEAQHPAAKVDRSGQIGNSIALAAAELAERMQARAVVATAHEFGVAAALASTRPQLPLVIVSDTQRCTRALALVRAVAPLQSGCDPRPDRNLTQARDWLYARRLARPGDKVVLLFASSSDQRDADTIQVAVLD